MSLIILLLGKKNIPILEAATLTSPSDDSTDISVTPTLDWDDVQYADTYDVQVATDSGFSGLVEDVTGLTESEYTISSDLDGDTEYFWRARAVNNSGAGNWSSTFSFTTEHVFDSDTLALFARCGTEPSTAEKHAIDMTIVALKAAGVWTKLDVLVLPRFFSVNTDAILNWKSTSYNATIVSSMSFTAHEGFQSNGTSSYLNSNYNLSTAGGQYTLNDNCFGIMVCSNIQNSAMIDIGARQTSGATNLSYLVTRNGSNGFGSVNNAATVVTVGAGSLSTSVGYTYSVRTAANAGTVYKNTAASGTFTTASSGLPNVTFFVGVSNLNGSPNFYSTRIIGGYWVGASLNATNVSDMTTAIENGLDSITAGIL